MSKVCILGLGYIGLPTAALAASRGHEVVGVDINDKIVETVNAGRAHIEEPGLSELVAEGVGRNRLRATSKPESADIFLIIVPTPFTNSHEPDMTYVRAAAASIAPLLEAGNLVVLESTSPVGATRKDVAEVIYAARPDLEGALHIAFCPERAIPGATLRELMENDRCVGGVDAASTAAAANFYRSFVQGDILETTADTAELVKLTENAFRDTNIAFANELSLVCDHLGVNVWETIRLANHHPRVNILQPGPGVGGHCIAVDPWFIVSSAPEQARLMRTAREVNDGKPNWVIGKVAEAVAELGGRPTVALLGLAFKPDVEDLRESPAVTVARGIKEAINADIIVCEPHIDSFDGFTLKSLDDALAAADIVVMLTDHTAFRSISLERLAGKTLIDTRGTFEQVKKEKAA